MWHSHVTPPPSIYIFITLIFQFYQSVCHLLKYKIDATSCICLSLLPDLKAICPSMQGGGIFALILNFLKVFVIY